MQLKDLPIGSLVKEPASLIHGDTIVWKVVDKNHTNYPTNSVTLLTDKIITFNTFDAKEATNPDKDYAVNYGNTDYSVSNIRQWLNSNASAGNWYSAQHDYDAPPSAENLSQQYTHFSGFANRAGFLTNLSAQFKNLILPTTVTSPVGEDVVNTIENQLIFLPSETEVGRGVGSTRVAIGTIFEYFGSVEVGSGAYKTTATIGALNDAITSGLDRVVLTADTTKVYNYMFRHTEFSESYIGTSDGSEYAYDIFGVRPVCNIVDTVYVTERPGEDGCYTIIYEPLYNEYLNGAGLSKVLTNVKNYIDNVSAPEIVVGDTPPEKDSAKLWLDTSSSNSTVSGFWAGTQAEYNSLTTKNPTTLYLIKEG